MARCLDCERSTNGTCGMHGQPITVPADFPTRAGRAAGAAVVAALQNCPECKQLRARVAEQRALLEEIAEWLNDRQLAPPFIPRMRAALRGRETDNGDEG